MTDYMGENLDGIEVEIPCPKCEKPIPEKIGRLKNDATLICPACGATIAIEAEQFRESVRRVNESIDNLRRQLGKKIEF